MALPHFILVRAPGLENEFPFHNQYVDLNDFAPEAKEAARMEFTSPTGDFYVATPSNEFEVIEGAFAEIWTVKKSVAFLDVSPEDFL